MCDVCASVLVCARTCVCTSVRVWCMYTCVQLTVERENNVCRQNRANVPPLVCIYGTGHRINTRPKSSRSDPQLAHSKPFIHNDVVCIITVRISNVSFFVFVFLLIFNLHHYLHVTCDDVSMFILPDRNLFIFPL